MIHHDKGFSLVELLLALTLALGLSTMLFQMFHQNERVIRDQTLIMEMQQTARAVTSQIADEVRMAGQNVPSRVAGFDTTPSEAVAVILGTTTSTRIDFRAGLSNVETTTSSAASLDIAIGSSQTIFAMLTSGFVAGKFLYLSSNSSWVRAEITGVTATALTMTPRSTGTTDATVHFASPPIIALEEAVSFFLSSGTVKRATAANFTNPAAPTWSAANEIGKNFKALTFTYYDANGNVLQPNSLSSRLGISRIDIQTTVEVANDLSNGTHPTYSLMVKTFPRNLRFH